MKGIIAVYPTEREIMIHVNMKNCPPVRKQETNKQKANNIQGMWIIRFMRRNKPILTLFIIRKHCLSVLLYITKTSLDSKRLSLSQ